MPYVSEAQRKYFHANRKKLEAQGVNVAEWDAVSKGKKLPKRVKKKKYQFGGDDDGSEFFNSIADMAIQQQQPKEFNPADYGLTDEESQSEDSQEGGDSSYDDLQSQIEDLKSQLEDVKGKYDPLFNSAHQDDDFLNQLFSSDGNNDPLIFDEMPSPSSQGTSSDEPVGNRELEAFNFFKEKGLPDHVAAGIVGNLKHESGFNVNAVGDGGKAKGLAQWHPDRYNRLKQTGHDLSSFHGNLQAIYDELNTTEKNAFNKLLQTNTAEQAAAIFDKAYERSSGSTTQRRMNTASSIMRKAGKYQFGGTANTTMEQYDGLNNPDYSQMVFPLEGINTFRGLDNGQPVLVHDEFGKQKILKGNKNTASFRGKVFEIKLPK